MDNTTIALATGVPSALAYMLYAYSTLRAKPSITVWVGSMVIALMLLRANQAALDSLALATPYLIGSFGSALIVFVLFMRRTWRLPRCSEWLTVGAAVLAVAFTFGTEHCALPTTGAWECATALVLGGLSLAACTPVCIRVVRAPNSERSAPWLLWGATYTAAAACTFLLERPLPLVGLTVLFAAQALFVGCCSLRSTTGAS